MASSWLIPLVVLLACSDIYVHGDTLTDQQCVLTNTTYGTLRGVARVSAAGTVISYLGVPYAKPPTGPRRFTKPEKPDSWTGERDAQQLGPMCPQYTDRPASAMSEDCLTLNIFTPALSAGQLPVMFWVHGGSFLRGAGTIFNGTELAHKGVVVVTINYRLDALGFMSTEDASSPGNFGLLDQIMALQWVKENIASFGGDPNQVTIFGESAGGGSVALLILSPMTAGLFQKAIVESGSSLSPWAVNFPTSRMTPNLIARQVGGKVNCTQSGSSQFVDCMRNVSIADLLKASADFRADIQLEISFTPVIETTFKVVPDRPYNLLTSGNFNHVDTIRGYNTDEALFLLGAPVGITREEFRQKMSKVIMPFNIPEVNNLLKDFEDLYLGNSTDPDFIIRQALTALSDYAFIAPTILESTLVSSAAPERKSFLYEFEYRQSVSTSPSWIHAVHGDEVPFVFDAFNNLGLWPVDLGHTPDDDRIAEQIMTIWTNFAKTGSPINQTTSSLSWPQFSATQQQLLRIDKVTTTTVPSKQPAVNLYNKILQLMEKKSVGTVVG